MFETAYFFLKNKNSAIILSLFGLKRYYFFGLFFFLLKMSLFEEFSTLMHCSSVQRPHEPKYITLIYTTTPHLTTLHYTTLHHISPHNTTPHLSTQHYTVLHHAPPHYIAHSLYFPTLLLILSTLGAAYSEGGEGGCCRSAAAPGGGRGRGWRGDS